MNRKRNVNYIKPEDPEFLKVLKRQAGYDDKNHKFDDLQNADEDFAEDEESERPQIVVLKKGDLTAEEAELEQKRIEDVESKAKADLTQRIIFKTKVKTCTTKDTNKRKYNNVKQKDTKKSRQLLSFDDEAEEEED